MNRRLLWGLCGCAALTLFLSCSRRERPATAQAVALHTVVAGIRGDMQRIAAQTERLAAGTAAAYVHAEARIPGVDTNHYRMTGYGGYYKVVEDKGPALWVSGIVPVDEEVKRVAWLTESLDDELMRIVRELPEVSQAYYNDRHSLNRIYPAFDVLAQYEPKMDITSFNFYYLADERHNPNRGPVWVDEPYVDPAGRGWMISSVAPVYVSNRLEGVVGLDVTVQKIVDRYLSFAQKNILLVDHRGIIVAADPHLIDLFEMPPLKDHRYLETIKSDHYLPDDYNLLKAKTKEVRQMAVQVLQQGAPSVRIVLRGKPFLVLAEPVAILRWTALLVEPMD